MQLQYVGPKVEITKNGVDFDMNKEDKYVYLNIAIQLIKALQHDYLPERVYTYSADNMRLSNHEINDLVTQYCPNISTSIAKVEKETKMYIANTIERIKKNTILHEDEKKAYLKNIELMRDYITQRTINKAAYYCVVEQLAEQLKNENIDYVIVPMFQKFSHVLHSAQGVLRRQKFPIDSKIEIYVEDGKLLFKLDVINR
ncbi:MAG: hypothetical protein U9Q62_01310 [Campylobacterota bacterium]|nr:hypothetical protein [Campylobacterota bacterium]